MVILILLGHKLLRPLIKPVVQITKTRKYQPSEMGYIGEVAFYPMSLWH